MIIVSIDLTSVIVACIAGAPGIIAAIYGRGIRTAIKPPSGGTIGEAVEKAHHLGAVNSGLLVGISKELATGNDKTVGDMLTEIHGATSEQAIPFDTHGEPESK